MTATFFSGQTEFRKWLDQNHNKKQELWVGYYKKATGLPSMTWSESVDEALCFGWIDGIRKSIDEKSYMIRFTPRNPKSTWSAVNIKKVAKLKKNGLMSLSGIKAFPKRDKKNSKIYSFERKNVTLASKHESAFKQNKKAWSYFKLSAPSYKKQAIWWVMSAKKEETRQRRLGVLIHHSAKEDKIPQVDWKKKKQLKTD